MALGAHGVISVASNIIPRPVAKMVRAAAAGDFVAARKLHDQYHPLFRDLFIETNPIPVKAALVMMGQIAEEYRLPLVPMSAKNRDILKATLARCGLISK
jgi:4-hydroxy-tetrahydrodipicolinate synthase